MQILLRKEFFPPSTLPPGASRGEPKVSQKMSAFGPRDAQAPIRFSHDTPIANVPIRDWFNFHCVRARSCTQQFPPRYFWPSFSMSFGQIFLCGNARCGTGDPTQHSGKCLWQWQLLLWQQTLSLSPAAACKVFRAAWQISCHFHSAFRSQALLMFYDFQSWSGGNLKLTLLCITKSSIISVCRTADLLAVQELVIKKIVNPATPFAPWFFFLFYFVVRDNKGL